MYLVAREPNFITGCNLIDDNEEYANFVWTGRLLSDASEIKIAPLFSLTTKITVNQKVCDCYDGEHNNRFHLIFSSLSSRRDETFSRSELTSSAKRRIWGLNVSNFLWVHSWFKIYFRFRLLVLAVCDRQ